MKLAVLQAVLAARKSKTPLAVVTRLADGAQALVWRDRAEGALTLGDAALVEIRDRLRSDRSGTIADGSLFVQVNSPPLRLIIVGAVHISQTLAPMAAIAGYEVIVVDPRASFATPERFPGVTLVDDWPDEAMQRLAPDTRTAIVTLTHDPKLDDPGLHVALRSDAFYIACLGSRRTHARRVDRLKEAGFGPEAIGRIHGPAGLAIGALSPAEVALSILAELTAVRHGRAPALAAA
jgi:xanthine dehydrogenase accessory factor